MTLQWTRAVFASLPALLLPSYREKRQSPIACGERNVDSTHADGTTISSPKPVISLSGGGAQDAHGETGVHRNAALTGDKMKRIITLRGHQMKNPWMKKNPLMSIWMSGANAVLGSARSYAAAQAKRQTAAIMLEGRRQMMRFWTAAVTAPPSRKKKRSR